MGEAGTHALKINQIGLPVSDQNVLRLKIAMDQNAREFGEGFANLRQRGQLRDLGGFRLLDVEIATNTIFKKVTLFPKIKRGVEFRRQMLSHFNANRLRKLVKLACFIESRFVKGAPNQP